MIACPTVATRPGRWGELEQGQDSQWLGFPSGNSIKLPIKPPLRLRAFCQSGRFGGQSPQLRTGRHAKTKTVQPTAAMLLAVPSFHPSGTFWSSQAAQTQAAQTWAIKAGLTSGRSASPVSQLSHDSEGALRFMALGHLGHGQSFGAKFPLRFADVVQDHGEVGEHVGPRARAWPIGWTSSAVIELV